MNRNTALVAHRHGFPVLELEELERRMLFKQEYSFAASPGYLQQFPGVVDPEVLLRPSTHLAQPGPEIIGTSLLSLIECLRLNGTAPTGTIPPSPATLAAVVA
jgi:hypothetical protein